MFKREKKHFLKAHTKNLSDNNLLKAILLLFIRNNVKKKTIFLGEKEWEYVRHFFKRTFVLSKNNAHGSSSPKVF